MEEAGLSVTTANFDQTARRHIPEYTLKVNRNTQFQKLVRLPGISYNYRVTQKKRELLKKPNKN